MFDARDVYELQRDLDREIMDHTTLPAWDDLSWAEHDTWQIKADEVNDKNMKELIEEGVFDAHDTH